VDTSESFTTDPHVAIGELVHYRVTITLDPGSYLSATLTDTMDLGLAYASCASVDFNGVTTTASHTDTNCDLTVTVNDMPPSPKGDGSQVVFTLGNLNVGSEDGPIVIEYWAVVLDIIDNQEPNVLKNSPVFAWSLGSTQGNQVSVDIVEPDLTIDKTADTNILALNAPVVFTLSIAHALGDEVTAYDVVLRDVFPDIFEFVSFTCSGVGGNTNPDTAAVTPPGPSTPPYTLLATWAQFDVGDTGVCQVHMTVNSSLVVGQQYTNSGFVDWTSLPVDPTSAGDPYASPPVPPVYANSSSYNDASHERHYNVDPLDNYGTVDTFIFNSTGGGEPGCKGANCFRLPVTGYEPGVLTELGAPPAYAGADNMGVTLEIPKLKLKMPVTGVPLVNGVWKVDWLTGVGGWLQGTAFPGLTGNSIITSHVVTNTVTNGPFARLGSMAVGDKFFITAFNRQYVYEVKSVANIAPNDSSVFKHADKSVVTLMTCSRYNLTTKQYDARLVVRAELVQVNPVK
jgi:LPXTG-site transpeptidase (sortase) family protein